MSPTDVRSEQESASSSVSIAQFTTLESDRLRNRHGRGTVEERWTGSALSDVPAGVGGDQGAVDQGGLVGAEPGDQLGDLRRLDEPADRVGPLDLLPDLGRGDRLR